MSLNDDVSALRAKRLSAGGTAVPNAFQGVTKDKVKQVLTALHLGGNTDLIDGVFALLDDESPSWFAKAPVGCKFSEGATTAHLACHIGILQRGQGKLDREGRDYWIKPLRELGGIEPVLLIGSGFVHGHVVAKSPNSAYRLSDDFREVLKASDAQWPKKLTTWAGADSARQRREFQAKMAEDSRRLVDTGHSDRWSIRLHGRVEQRQRQPDTVPDLDLRDRQHPSNPGSCR